jgi:hypothetical protein
MFRAYSEFAYNFSKLISINSPPETVCNVHRHRAAAVPHRHEPARHLHHRQRSGLSAVKAEQHGFATGLNSMNSARVPSGS